MAHSFTQVSTSRAHARTAASPDRGWLLYRVTLSFSDCFIPLYILKLSVSFVKGYSLVFAALFEFREGPLVKHMRQIWQVTLAYCSDSQ